MTREEAITYGKEQLEIFGGLHREFIEMAIKAIENISHLTDRPCDACEYHKENGCSRWSCVFERKGV